MHVSEILVSYFPYVKSSEQPQVTSSGESFQIFLEHWDHKTIHLKEDFKILLLNRANRVLGIYAHSSGGTTCTIVDPKLVFAVALKTASSGIILCHNHPSGSLKPSQRDEDITRRLKEAGKLLGIDIIDHLIINEESYYSFLDEGLL